MAKFTLLNDRTEVSTATMHVEGHKRLHLADAGADRKGLLVDSTNAKVVSGVLVALFNGPRGIWTVDLRAQAEGEAEVRAKLEGDVVATLAVTVLAKLELPPAASEEGMLVRLLLAENRTPDETGYAAAQSRTSMQWMRVVLANRLKDEPGRFAAAGAQTIADIVKAKDNGIVQFKGFQDYPALGAKQAARIREIVNIANNDNDARQEKYAQFLLNALEVGKSKTLIQDPCPTGLYGWRTVGHGSPGGNFVEYGDPLSGNQFYTLGK
jgi:hypothetical protein